MDRTLDRALPTSYANYSPSDLRHGPTGDLHDLQGFSDRRFSRPF